MPRVWVTHASAVTALGDTLDATWKGLLEGKTGIRRLRRFSTAPYPVGIAACIQDLDPGDSRSLIYDLIDRAMQNLPPLPKDTLLITATTKGPIDLMERVCRKTETGIETLLIPHLVASLSRKLKLQKSGFNISAACASSTVAISQACSQIALGKAEAVLVLCADLVSEFTFSGFSALQILSERPCAPFDRNRNGLSLGEGAAAILLMSPTRAKAEGLFPLATVCGWGVASDAVHITSPAKDGKGLIQAIKQALNIAGFSPDAISAVNAHGTGTVQNDRMELVAFHTVFGDRRLPIHSIKGAVGHTLGAAGGIEIAVSIRALQEKVIPPTTGFADPEPLGKGCIFSEPVMMPPGYVLTTNSGFGGVNAAIILGKGNAS
ncbi:MAG: beta-ketoacyl synthase [Desulfobacterales bacterium CG07_land_8_20_14_0_80_52_14]|nr:MAG: beta-ketoacyl synthase [Desulfobacterales bacterium CG23_combo_of_CG06-09_8_20_14_all_52_9]PIU49164.1 MAG: beta-ketoacyl synthase [Desulfobacterales bacterium CG07_land_8_20_14_0_80_52_14]